jgi:nicotinamidase-related amidase
MFEVLVAAEMNLKWALQGSDRRTCVNQLEGKPISLADLVTRDPRVNREDQGQVKFTCKTGDSLVDNIIDAKYDSINHLHVPADKMEEVVAELWRRMHACNDPRVAIKLKSALRRLEPNQVTTRDVVQADNNPRGYARRRKLSIFLKNELIHTTVNSSLHSSMTTGLHSMVRNGYAMLSGDLSPKEGILTVVWDTAEATVNGAIIGCSSATIRYTLKNLGVKTVHLAGIATDIAICLYNTAVTLHELATGKITLEEAFIRMGRFAVSLGVGVLVGVAAGILFGPLGFLVVGALEFMALNLIYDPVVKYLKETRQIIREAQEATRLIEAQAKRITEQRKKFEDNFNMELARRKEEQNRLLKTLDDGLSSLDHESVPSTLTRISRMWGKEIRTESFIEFDDLMMKPSPLTL